MSSRNHVIGGKAAKQERRNAAVERATKAYRTYNEQGYMRCADPKEFLPTGMTEKDAAV